MKYSTLLIVFFFLFVACGGGDTSGKYTGEWNLTKFVDKDGTEKTTDCDKQTIWNFTQEKSKALDDGTEVMKLVATAPDDCKWYGFEANWAPQKDKLFISTTNVGGMGGNSSAGLFEIVSYSKEEMVLKIQDRSYSFSKK